MESPSVCRVGARAPAIVALPSVWCRSISGVLLGRVLIALWIAVALIGSVETFRAIRATRITEVVRTIGFVRGGVMGARDRDECDGDRWGYGPSCGLSEGWN